MDMNNRHAKDPLLSIIVPVYNSSEYIEECVNSILRQSYKNIELILVDDGSTDDSYRICREMSSANPCIKVIQISNSGIYQARKAGVECAKGELLTFVDSDDWVDDGYREMIEIFKMHNPDMICFNYRYNKEGNEVTHLYPSGMYMKPEIENEIQEGMMFAPSLGRRKFDPSLCCKIIKKELYIQLTREVTDRISLGEDALVTYPAVCVANSLYISDSVFYHYRVNEKSCTQQIYAIDRINEIRAFHTNIRRVMAECGMGNRFDVQIECYVRLFISKMLKDWFNIERSAVMYMFPYYAVGKNTKLIIYGAGNVGKSYVYSLRQSGYAQIVAWCDKKADSMQEYGGIDVLMPEAIKEKVYDSILIAIENKKTAYNIQDYLISMGVDSKKICWEQPILIG